MFKPRKTLILIHDLEDAIARASDDIEEARQVLNPVFERTCAYLTELLDDPEFRFSLEKLLQTPQRLEIADFEDFLKREREALILYGANDSTIQRALEELRNLQGNINIDEPIDVDHFIETLNHAAQIICTLPRIRFENVPHWRRAIKNVVGVIAGIVIVSANVLVAIHIDQGIISGNSVKYGAKISYNNAQEIIETIG